MIGNVGKYLYKFTHFIWPSIRCTIQIFQTCEWFCCSLYFLNVKCAKNHLPIHANCPPFIDGLWTDVLLDRYVDLDRVFTGYYSIDSDNCHTQSLGNIKFVVNGGSSTKPNKTIKNHGEWAIAFAATRATILFAYLHRSRELSEYERYIVGQFAAILDVTQHPHIIALNWAICCMYAEVHTRGAGE